MEKVLLKPIVIWPSFFFFILTSLSAVKSFIEGSPFTDEVSKLVNFNLYFFISLYSATGTIMILLKSKINSAKFRKIVFILVTILCTFQTLVEIYYSKEFTPDSIYLHLLFLVVLFCTWKTIYALYILTINLKKITTGRILINITGYKKIFILIYILYLFSIPPFLEYGLIIQITNSATSIVKAKPNAIIEHASLLIYFISNFAIIVIPGIVLFEIYLLVKKITKATVHDHGNDCHEEPFILLTHMDD